LSRTPDIVIVSVTVIVIVIDIVIVSDIVIVIDIVIVSDIVIVIIQSKSKSCPGRLSCGFNQICSIGFFNDDITITLLVLLLLF